MSLGSSNTPSVSAAKLPNTWVHSAHPCVFQLLKINLKIFFSRLTLEFPVRWVFFYLLVFLFIWKRNKQVSISFSHYLCPFPHFLLVFQASSSQMSTFPLIFYLIHWLFRAPVLYYPYIHTLQHDFADSFTNDIESFSLFLVSQLTLGCLCLQRVLRPKGNQLT